MNRIYWNLHKKCYSVQRKVDGRWKVCMHADELYLDNVTFFVSPTGRERVRREGRKNVHAFILAEHVTVPDEFNEPEHDVEITYNPYVHTEFTVKLTGDDCFDPLHPKWAYAAHLNTNGLVHSHRKPRIWLQGVVYRERVAA